MMEGKIPENILKRSVLREIKNINEDVITGASFGKDCAVLNLRNSDFFMNSETEDSSANGKMIGRVAGSCVAQGEGITESGIALIKACNGLYSGGFTPLYILLSITIPVSFEESDLKNLMKELESAAEKEGVTIVGGHTAASASLTDRSIVGVTALGVKNKDFCPDSIRPGDSIIASKWIGIEGSFILAKERKEEITERFKEDFTNGLEKNHEFLSVGKEASEALGYGIKAMKDVSEHGIFGALYELSEVSGHGLKVNIKDIPVKQDVIELCNFYDINPYEMKSSGMLLMVCEDGEGLSEALRNCGIDATVIGCFTDNNDKIVLNGEEKRFLDKIKQDSVYRIKKD